MLERKHRGNESTEASVFFSSVISVFPSQLILERAAVPYKFKNQHALAVIAILVFIVIAGRMSFRPRTYVSDLSLVSWMLAAVALTSACASYFFRARLPTICLLAGIVGSAFTWIRPTTVSCLNCFFEIREAGITNGETFYINSNENFILIAVSLSTVSIVFGGLVGTAIVKYRAWLEVNRVNFFGTGRRNFFIRLAGF